ncbi:MepB family protein [Lysobacter antibioticus]|uniref:MepB family protein n=1 Tax=Lysobacter antibioticus TaxID=84531 RepID=UPI000A731A8F|nr:MepB family protein [Lysobacter antibioticus]
MHNDLIAAKALVYDPGRYELAEFRAEAESSAYAACTFRLDGASICFRVAKTTPVKAGQFVTLWKRIGAGPIQPFDSSDDVDFYVVSARCRSGFGQFVFPKRVLSERGVLSSNGKGGKRAIRVYPPWDTTKSGQARVTQDWQLRYFLEIGDGIALDRDRCRMLYAPGA